MKVSVITVCYNSTATIRDTIVSVANQTYQNVEHIVVDGGSSDGTMEIVSSAPSVAGYVSEMDAGIYDAMNKGLKLATGDIIGFLNADDFYADKNVLSDVAREFEDIDINACYGDLLYVSPQNINKTIRYWKSASFHGGLFSQGWMPPHPTFFVRRNIYEKLGGFNLEYKIAADVELMMRFLEVHRIKAIYLPRVLVRMRLGGTTNKSFSNVIKQNREIVHALKQHGKPTSLFRLFAYKLLSRGPQFFMKPQQE